MSYVGDIRLGDTIDVKFCTVSTTGAPTTLAGSPAISAYPSNSTTELTAGITLTVDFDARTGLHNVRVVATSGNGYATATDYALVITAGTVGGTSVVGYVIGEFSIEKRSALMPTTAARTLVVDAAGLADANVVKVGPTGSGTAQTAGDIMADTNDIQTRLPAALVSGRMDCSVGAMAANVLTATAIAADAITDAKVAADVTIASVTGAVGSVTGAVGSVTGAVGSVTGNVGGNVTGSVGSVATGGLTAASFAADSITAAKLAADVTTELQAGLATAANLATVAGYVDTEVAAIKAVTDKLDTALELDGAVYRFTVNALELAPAGGSGLDAAGVRAAIGLASANLDTQLSTIDDFLDTEVAAIKAKTDQLTFTVANTLNTNITYVNGTQVIGDGASGSEWGPAP